MIMVNDVKFDPMDNINSLLVSKKTEKNIQKKPLYQTDKEGVQVKLSSFHEVTLADNTAEDNTRVLEMKQRIQSNHYKVDTDELAKRMYHNIFQPNKIIG
jgi:anti-sigma28 factor (negative regulator of flagellin synthesis)